MSLHFNPWVALVLGILIGWLLEWLLELWYFRRQRLECQRRLAEVEAHLKTRDGELRDARARADSLDAELKGLKASTVAVAPAVEVEAPVAKLAGAAVAAGVGAGIVGLVAKEGDEEPSAQVKAPEVEAGMPEVQLAAEMPQVEVSDIVLPEATGADKAVSTAEVAELARVVRVEVEQLESEVAWLEAEDPATEAELSAVAVRAPALEAEEPKTTAPGVAVGAGIGLGVAALAHELKGEAPQVEAEAPTVEAEVPGVEAEVPAVEVRAPEVEVPEVAEPAAALEAEPPHVAVEMPEIAVEPPEGEVAWPEVSATVGGAAVGLTEARDQGPSVGDEPPPVEVDLPASSIEAVQPAAPPIEADDLAAIKGIGPKYAAQLAAAGVTSFSALAEADPERLQAIISASGGRKADYESWIAQARRLIGQEG